MIVLQQYAIVGLISLLVGGLALLTAALFWAWQPEEDPARLDLPAGWSNYRFGYPIYALIFLSFDMEMIFMYPWAVVFVNHGLEAFLDMFVFIAILSAGISYAWGMGGLKWE